jgi:virginiamycin B lyase
MGATYRLGLAVLCAFPALAAAQPVHHRYPLPAPEARPSSIGADDDVAWFAETDAASIATLNERGELVEYRIEDAGSRPYAVAPSRLDGRILFTDVGLNRVGLVNSAARFTWIDIPTRNSLPLGVAFDDAGAVWFTEHAVDRIGHAIAGVVREIELPAGSAPYGIAPGEAGGRVWFTEYGTNRIGTLDAIGARGEFAIPTPDSGPTSIALGPDGVMWFTESRANKIARITVFGEVEEFEVPTPDSEPGDLSAAYGGLWFAERAAGKIGFISRDGVIREYDLPDGARANGLAYGGGASVWYVDPDANAAGRVSSNVLYAVGAGTVGTWDTRFTVRPRDGAPAWARIGVPVVGGGACPGSCFDPAVTLDLSSGDPRTALASQIPYDGGLELLQVSDASDANPGNGDFGTLPDVDAGVENAALPAQSGILPLVDRWTIVDAEPPATGRERAAVQPRLSFPARREPGVHANLVVNIVEGEDTGRESLLLEAVADGEVVASRPLVGRPTFFLVDVLGALGLDRFEGELRITRQSTRCLFWAVLASVRIDGVDFTAPTAELVTGTDATASTGGAR